MSLSSIPLKTPLLYLKNFSMKGIPIFLFLIQSIGCGYSLEPSWCGSTCTHNLCFEQKYDKYEKFSGDNFKFLKHKKNIACFLNVTAEY